MDLVGYLTALTWVEVLVLLVGMGLVIFEMFHPGFGAPGIVGGLLLLLGVIFTARSLQQAVILLLIILGILAAALSFVLHSATRGKLARHIVLKEAQNKEAGYIGSEDLEYFVGKVGTVISILRPSGIADFDGVKLDVVSESEFVPQGTRVTVIKAEGRRIIVRKVNNES